MSISLRATGSIRRAFSFIEKRCLGTRVSSLCKTEDVAAVKGHAYTQSKHWETRGINSQCCQSQGMAQAETEPQLKENWRGGPSKEGHQMQGTVRLNDLNVKLLFGITISPMERLLGLQQDIEKRLDETQWFQMEYCLIHLEAIYVMVTRNSRCDSHWLQWNECFVQWRQRNSCFKNPFCSILI